MSFGSQVAEQSHDRLWVAARDFRESGAPDVEKIDRSHIGPVPAPPIPDTVLRGKLLILARAFPRQAHQGPEMLQHRNLSGLGDLTPPTDKKRAGSGERGSVR